MKYTPMFVQYNKVKLQVPDCILFYRLGDFYEMFFDDARVAAKELDIVLTARESGMGKVDMCGVPHHSHDSYLSRLVKNGHKVAICEQTTPPGKGLVEREVVRIVTPGTNIENEVLNRYESNYVCCVYGTKQSNQVDVQYGVAWADVSVNEYNFAKCQKKQLQDILSNIRPREVICNDEIFADSFDFDVVKSGDCPKFSKFYDWAFEQKATNLVVFVGLKKNSTEEVAANALLQYIEYTHKSHAQTKRASFVEYNAHSYMLLNHTTRRTLEISHNMRDGGKAGTLESVVNCAVTNMGKRKLSSWIQQPLVEGAAILYRQAGVQALRENTLLRERLADTLDDVSDIERLAMRILYKNARPNDLVLLSKSLKEVSSILQLLESLVHVPILVELCHNIGLHAGVIESIDAAIVHSGKAQEGNTIQVGYNATLDELKQLRDNSISIIAQVENKEREISSIKKLKINYNRVAGYFIEIPKSNSVDIPYRYIRKGTTVNAERYTTDELDTIAHKIVGAQDSILQLEQQLYDQLLATLSHDVADMLRTATNIAQLDALVALATLAYKHNYTCPVITVDGGIAIFEGRHPVTERIVQSFVPNDTHLAKGSNAMIITGPNMSGKSVYMRQVAHIVILAQIGSFVPCQSCTVQPLDAIFARVGSGDDMLSGRSTFMVEMTEVANIVDNLTDNSLVILDEVGRGTSTYDGISIAQAIVEHIVTQSSAFLLFSTHYHELTVLIDSFAQCVNYQMAVQEIGDNITFLNKIVKGHSNKSFGIQVAALSGLPISIIDRAKDILQARMES